MRREGAKAAHIRHHAEKKAPLITGAMCNPGGHSYSLYPEEMGRDAGLAFFLKQAVSQTSDPSASYS